MKDNINNEKNIKRSLFIPDEKEIKIVNVSENNIPINLVYSSLTPEFEEEFKAFNNKSRDNAINYIKEELNKALKHLLKCFSNPKKMACFSGKYAINMFLAKDFEEMSTTGVKSRINMPKEAIGYAPGTNLVYLQKGIINHFHKKPQYKYLETAHELLHNFFQFNNIEKHKQIVRVPFLFNEGFEVICGNQLNKSFNEYVNPKLLLEKMNMNFLDYDKRPIIENSTYQSAGQFMSI
ncbi:hypothetical protein JXA48_00705 [Candidatus Woesearchaeota archaeon]|nr:hypothetical protein [Candidatus Woesearchaeota archaeon]